jgi:hypothetical protein
LVTSQMHSPPSAPPDASRCTALALNSRPRTCPQQPIISLQVISILISNNCFEIVHGDSCMQCWLQPCSRPGRCMPGPISQGTSRGELQCNISPALFLCFGLYSAAGRASTCT